VIPTASGLHHDRRATVSDALEIEGATSDVERSTDGRRIPELCGSDSQEEHEQRRDGHDR